MPQSQQRVPGPRPMMEPSSPLASRSDSPEDANVGTGQGLQVESRVDDTTSTYAPPTSPMSPTGTTINYSTPESVNCSYDSSFGSSRVVDCRSPSSRRQSSNAQETGETAQGSPRSNEGDSSYEIIQHTASSSRTLPPPSLPLPNPIISAPPKTGRHRAFSAAIPRLPAAKGSTPVLILAPERMQRRASHDGAPSLRARSSLTPLLSPIRDTADDRNPRPQDPPLVSLVPTPPKRRGSLPFPDNVSFEYIVQYGKNEFGDLTKEARAAMGRLGLRSIPSFHGPMNLPYARCPS